MVCAAQDYALGATTDELLSDYRGISRAGRVYEARKPKNTMYNLNLVSK